MKCMWKRECFFSQPFHQGMIVRGVVVADDVHVEVFGDLLVDLLKELLELDRTMLAMN